AARNSCRSGEGSPARRRSGLASRRRVPASSPRVLWPSSAAASRRRPRRLSRCCPTVVWSIVPPRSAAIVPPSAAAGNDAPDRDRGTVRNWPGGVSSAPAPACRSVLRHRPSPHRPGIARGELRQLGCAEPHHLLPRPPLPSSRAERASTGAASPIPVDVDFESALGVSDPQQTLHTQGDDARLWDLASVFKPIAALGVLIAVERGLVDLDEAVDVPPSVTTPVPEGATVRHLLAHTAGYAFAGP